MREVPRPAPEWAAGEHTARSLPEAGSGPRAAGPAAPQRPALATAPAAARGTCRPAARGLSPRLESKARPPTDAFRRGSTPPSETFLTDGTTLPFCSTSAVTSPSAGRWGHGGLRHCRRQFPSPRYHLPRTQGKAGAAGEPLPRPAATTASPFLFFFFFFLFRNPLWGRVISEEPAASFKSGRKRRNRRTPYRSAVPLPARPLLLPRPATSAAAGGGGTIGPAAAGRTGPRGRRDWMFFPRSPSVSVMRAAFAKGLHRAAAEPPAGSKLRAGTAALTRLGEPPWSPSPPLSAPSSLRPRSAEAAGCGLRDACGTQWSPGGDPGPALGTPPGAPAERSRRGGSRGAPAEGAGGVNLTRMMCQRSGGGISSINESSD